MDITVLIIVAVVLAVLLLAVLIRLLRLEQRDTASLLKTDLVELNRSLLEMQHRVGDKLERGSSAMQASMQQQLRQSSQLVAEVNTRLAKLDETNRRVVDVASDLKTLQNVLQNPKQRGVFGEFYLESVLDNVLPPKHYQMQYSFQDGEIVDAVVILEKGKLLPVDSKFSLENYNRMVTAGSKAERQALLGKVRTDLKQRIDETSKYIRPSENTMEFAFMFIPSEALYYDLLIGTVGTQTSARDLLEYAFRDKKVIVVSPTSFMAYLQTVLQGLRSLEIESQAKEIQSRVGQLGRHIASYELLMQKLGSSLGTTVNHFNHAHKELKKIDKDVVKIADSTPAVEPLVLDKPSDGS